MAVLKDLIVHGPSRFINTAQFEALKANRIGAEEGVFNKLIATNADIGTLDVDDLTAQNATVVGLLDVQGEMHTNSWTNANIANIGGSFYIAPTIIPTDGTTTISITKNSATSWTVVLTGTFATDFIKTGTNTTGQNWPANSSVLVTGNITVKNMKYPLGTLKGTLSAAVTASAASTSKTVTITGVTDGQGHTTPAVLDELWTLNGANISNAAFSDGKISLYKMGSYPIGIQMSSMGTNANSMIEIYGGVAANPTVRIGHLAGLPTINGTSPTGWGIYTDNGYFTGVIVSTAGKIGGFTIGSTDLYNGTLGAANSVWMSTGTSGSASIGGSSSINNWAFTASNQFGVTKTGELWANLAHIKGSIDATSFQARDGSGNIRAIVDSNGLTVKDAAGNMVAAFSGSGVSFSSSVSQKIGNNTNYIEFNPTTNRINIIGSGVYFGSTPIDDVATTGNIDTAISTTKAELDATKIDVVGESTSLLDNINAISDQITLSASRINFGNITIADNLAQLNTAVSIDTATSTVYIGDQSSFHVRINGTELGFYQGAQRVAYINNNQLYITQSVVLQQMDLGTKVNNGGLGQWSWKVHANGATPRRNNLNLKWIG